MDKHIYWWDQRDNPWIGVTVYKEDGPEEQAIILEGMYTLFWTYSNLIEHYIFLLNIYGPI